MTAKFFAILTSQGATLLANATALGTKLNITQMAVGDGNGTLPTPDATQTKLVNQKRIAPLNMLSVDANNASQIIAEQVIPENEGGFWIREIGLYDDNGILIAVANCPETYKPQLQEGSGRTQTIRMVLIVSSTAAVTLKIDPSVVLATRQYVDNAVIEVKAYADNLLKQHIADTNPHTQYAPLASPVFTGTPKAPTAAQTSNDTQLANTAFVQAAIAALVSGELAKKQPLDKTLTELSGKSVAAILEYLGLGDGSALPVGTPVPWPASTPPAGWLKCNGATFTATQYPKLALAYPGLVLPDLRGEFIRGWDEGRGVDAGRALLSSQGHAFAEHQHALSLWTGAALGKSNSRAVKYSPQASAGDGGTMEENTNSGGAAGYANSTMGVASSWQGVSSGETRPRNIAFNYIVRAA